VFELIGFEARVFEARVLGQQFLSHQFLEALRREFLNTAFWNRECVSCLSLVSEPKDFEPGVSTPGVLSQELLRIAILREKSVEAGSF